MSRPRHRHMDDNRKLTWFTSDLPDHIEDCEHDDHDGRCRKCHNEIILGHIEYGHQMSCQHWEKNPIAKECLIKGADLSGWPDDILPCECDNQHGICWQCGGHIVFGPDADQYGHSPDCKHHLAREPFEDLPEVRQRDT